MQVSAGALLGAGAQDREWVWAGLDMSWGGWAKIGLWVGRGRGWSGCWFAWWAGLVLVLTCMAWQGLLKIAVPNFIVWILGFYR